MQIILNRVLIRLEDIQREHDMGDGKKLILAYGELEKRMAASITQGVVVSIGPDAFSDWGYPDTKPIKPGDTVLFAKFGGLMVVDPERPDDRLAVINDEDVLAIIKSKEITNE